MGQWIFKTVRALERRQRFSMRNSPLQRLYQNWQPIRRCLPGSNVNGEHFLSHPSFFLDCERRPCIQEVLACLHTKGIACLSRRGDKCGGQNAFTFVRGSWNIYLECRFFLPRQQSIEATATTTTCKHY